jgi:peptidoglycan-N-acetylglucosamine deacetylase
VFEWPSVRARVSSAVRPARPQLALVLIAIAGLATVQACAREEESAPPLTSHTIDVPLPSGTTVAPSTAATSTIAPTSTTVSTPTTRPATTSTSQAPAPTTLPPVTTTTVPATTSTTTVPVTPPVTAVTPPVPATQPAALIWIGDASELAVALTFDAGSDAGHTSAILDELASRGIRATFALTGEWVEQNQTLARRIVADGHVVMNHSYDHPSFTGVSSDDVALTTEARWSQLDRAEAMISSTTGRTSLPYFRPPFGDQDASVARDAGARGYRYLVMWTVDSLGWKGTDPSDVVARCVGLAEPGAIMMFHVGSASTDAEALPAVIDQLSAQGYTFATLPELIG